jgi:hypothetical protein
MQRMLLRHRTTVGGRKPMADGWIQRTAVKFRSCDGPTEAVHTREKEYGIRSSDRNDRLCTKCVAYKQKRRNRDSNAVINTCFCCWKRSQRERKDRRT